VKHPNSPAIRAGLAAISTRLGPRGSQPYSAATQRAIDSKPDTIEVTLGKDKKETVARGADSMWHHSVPDGKGGYVLTRERQAVHDEIVRQALEGVPQNVANKTLCIMGGGGGSGKGTLLSSDDAKDFLPDGASAPGKHVRIDADALKEQLPEYEPMMVEGRKIEGPSFVHEESSWLTKRVQDAAEEQGSHIVLDGTGDSKISKVRDKIASAREKGYAVTAEYVTAPERTGDRSREGAGAWERNISRAKGSSRGLVPPFALLEAHTMVSRIVPELAPEFDTFRLWDTSGGGRRVIAGTSRGNPIQVRDQGAYATFLAKGRPGVTIDGLRSEADDWMRDITAADLAELKGKKK